MLCGWEGNRIGLASHWPCVTDSTVYPPTGSKANVREMSTLHTPQGMTPLPVTFKGIKVKVVDLYTFYLK